MSWKIILFVVVLLFTISFVWAENNTTENLELEDNGNYILPISISNGEIKFNDGFIGFDIDADKDYIKMSDKFLLSDFNENNIENTVKLIIIEAYKQGKEKEIPHLITELNNGNLNDNVIKEALNSNDKIGKNPIVKINNTTEATFNFEYLKSVDNEKSNCIAYKVSMKTVEESEILTISDENLPMDKSQDENISVEDNNENDTQNQNSDNKTINSTDNQKNENTDNNPKKSKDNETIVNKTNTIIVNENNTSIINNNVKIINNTTSTPENDTTSQLLKAAGNPIFILILIIAIIIIITVAVRRKD